MQQEVAEVLETNAKSKKCNPVEAGLYKFKAGKLDSGILYSVGIFPKKLPEKAATHRAYWLWLWNGEKNQTAISKEGIGG